MYSFFSKMVLVRRSYNNQLQEELLPHGVTTIQWALIRYLHENGSATFSDVADYWQVEKPSITPIAQKLVTQKIIDISSGVDKRQKIMKLSNNGLEVYRKVIQTTDLFLDELMDGIIQEEREVAEKLLEKLLVNLMKRG